MRITAPSQLPAGVAETLALLPPLKLFQVLAHAPSVLDAWLGLGGALLTTLELEPTLRDVVMLQVAADTDCANEARSTRRSELLELCAAYSPEADDGRPWHERVAPHELNEDGRCRWRDAGARLLSSYIRQRCPLVRWCAAHRETDFFYSAEQNPGARY